MALCALRCIDKEGTPREVSAGARSKICKHCRAGIGRDASKSGSELKIKQERNAAKGRQYLEITGRNGEGPPRGGYVAQLLVLRRARDRDKKKRHTRTTPTQHFPRVAH